MQSMALGLQHIHKQLWQVMTPSGIHGVDFQIPMYVSTYKISLLPQQAPSVEEIGGLSALKSSQLTFDCKSLVQITL